MTSFVHWYLYVSVAAVAIAWLKGGHPERLGATIWLFSWIFALQANDVRIGDLRWVVALADVASFAAFLWLGLRYERWWPLGVSALMFLGIMVHVSAFLIPELTPRGEASAQLGLGVLAVLILGGGAFERWLAGEPPVSATAVWGRRQRAT